MKFCEKDARPRLEREWKWCMHNVLVEYQQVATEAKAVRELPAVTKLDDINFGTSSMDEVDNDMNDDVESGDLARLN